MKIIDTQVFTEKPKVLILLATFNAGSWLVEQLNSIFSQEIVDVHVLIGDDRSSDGTAEFIQAQWKHDPRVELVVWDTPSGSAGGNFRRLYCYADASQFDYVALGDQDDIWFADKLASAVHALHMGKCAGYSCSVESFWPDGDRKIIKQSNAIRGADFLFEGGGQGCTFVVRQTLFLTLQNFCRTYPALANSLHYHDWLIYLLVRISGGNWYFDAAPHMAYRQHNGNEIGSRGSLSAITKRLELIKNGWYRKQLEASLAIVHQLNYQSNVIKRFDYIFNLSNSIKRRVYLAFFILKHGRRKFSDRIVLALTACLGWI